MTNYRFWDYTDPNSISFLLYTDWPEWQRPQMGQQLQLPQVTGDKMWRVTDIDPISNPTDQEVDYFLTPVVPDTSIDPMFILEGYEQD